MDDSNSIDRDPPPGSYAAHVENMAETWDQLRERISKALTGMGIVDVTGMGMDDETHWRRGVDGPAPAVTTDPNHTGRDRTITVSMVFDPTASQTTIWTMAHDAVARDAEKYDLVPLMDSVYWSALRVEDWITLTVSYNAEALEAE
jgi:hypothetical protein